MGFLIQILYFPCFSPHGKTKTFYDKKQKKKNYTIICQDSDDEEIYKTLYDPHENLGKIEDFLLSFDLPLRPFLGKSLKLICDTFHHHLLLFGEEKYGQILNYYKEEDSFRYEDMVDGIGEFILHLGDMNKVDWTEEGIKSLLNLLENIVLHFSQCKDEVVFHQQEKKYTKILYKIDNFCTSKSTLIHILSFDNFDIFKPRIKELFAIMEKYKKHMKKKNLFP